jgi:hypothetical protein
MTFYILCRHCDVKKFKDKTPKICCANGKVKLDALNSPPEPLLLFSDEVDTSIRIRSLLQFYLFKSYKHTFLQIYFTGDEDAQVDHRCDAISDTKLIGYSI